MEISINWLAVLLAGLSTFVIGGLWYSLLFAKPWQKEAGVTDEQMKKGAPRIFTLAFVLSIIMAASLAAFIGSGGLVFGTLAGLAVGVTWVAAAFGMTYLFERRSMRLFLINASYYVVAFTVMGAIIGAMQG